MTSPVIPWMGGKRRLADRLIPLFPPHECYVEVFAGSAALFFLRPQPAPVEALNDINGDLVCLYRVIQNHLEEFVRQFKWSLSSRQIFEWQKNDPAGNADGYPAGGTVLLSAATCVWRQGIGADLWDRYYCTLDKSAADRGKPVCSMAAVGWGLYRKPALAGMR